MTRLAVWDNPPVPVSVVFAEVRRVIDPQILQQIVARDATAVAELYDQCGRPLYALIHRIVRSRSDADEVLQDVFIRVWTRAEMYDERCGSPGAWLARIARNRAIDCLRARRARDAATARQAQSLETADVTTATGATAEAAEHRSTVRGALAMLPDDQRALIEAAFFEGYTHQELADRLGLPLGTVKTRIRSGMMTLRQRLERFV